MHLRRPSPNFGPRRGWAAPRLVMLHYTAMPSPEAALDRLCDPAAEVSAHWLVTAAGDTVALVDEAARAWHAGAGSWGGCRDLNSASIGIELDNDGAAPFAEPQMAALERLLAGILGRWHLGPAAVIGHSDAAFPRKTDPGPRFPWRRLAAAGLSVWPKPDTEPGVEPDAEPAEDWARAAAAFGYGGPDPLGAFRLRFRPDGHGPPDATDRAMIADLAARFPVDPEPPVA